VRPKAGEPSACLVSLPLTPSMMTSTPLPPGDARHPILQLFLGQIDGVLLSRSSWPCPVAGRHARSRYPRRR
jgi:hypothetical protein